ncbi:MAG TPA: dihydroneopterin aldolase [Acidimicrobiales bacterium]
MSPRDRLELRGLRVLARCGASPDERARAQPLELDLDLTVDLAAAGRSDDLADTVDYGAVCDVAVAAAESGPTALLESVAESVASALLAHDQRIGAVDVAVRKLRPPVPHHLATSGVRVHRERG